MFECVVGITETLSNFDEIHSGRRFRKKIISMKSFSLLIRKINFSPHWFIYDITMNNYFSSHIFFDRQRISVYF